MPSAILSAKLATEEAYKSLEGKAVEPSSKRKRKSRWASENEAKVIVPGLSTIMPSGLNNDQQQAYILQLQIEDISRKLRTGDLGIPINPEDRSPSPEPFYNSDGKRMNTREFRTRRKLEDDRHKLVEKLKEMNPCYQPPSDYKAPIHKVTERIMIPQDDHPEINFVGLLIGPRGNTLKKLETDTGAKVMIRGKGSAKEGRVGKRDYNNMGEDDEPLHALVSGPTADQVYKCCSEIKRIIAEGIEIPDSENRLRRHQLMELAQLNGTLRDMGLRCGNCGGTSHRTWNCPERQNVTNNIICHRCGSAGHVAQDCRANVQSAAAAVNPLERAKMDTEYKSFMAELGEGPPPTSDSSQTLPPGLAMANAPLVNNTLVQNFVRAPIVSTPQVNQNAQPMRPPMPVPGFPQPGMWPAQGFPPQYQMQIPPGANPAMFPPGAQIPPTSTPAVPGQFPPAVNWNPSAFPPAAMQPPQGVPSVSQTQVNWQAQPPPPPPPAVAPPLPPSAETVNMILSAPPPPPPSS